MSSETAICTIFSKNYLAYTRTLTNSFLRNNPESKVFALLVDEIDEKFDPKGEKFVLIKINEIGIKNLQSFSFKYNILEQNTGAKANFMKYLFEKYHMKKLIYFDPDILILNNLENLWKLLEKKSIVLTPHITKPITDKKYPSEYDIMKSGAYNLGFIALSNTKTTEEFLNWWILHLMEHGYNDVNKGMFTDQKWIDLVPSIFDDVYIIRHPGYNIAYWNLMQRDVKINDGKVSVNGMPAYFFHFSGFTPEKIEDVSKHQNRFKLKDLKHLRPLFELYRDLLIENNYLKIKNWKVKFDYFDNGVKIPSSARKIYAESIKEGKDFGNPFETSGSQSFINYLNENIDKKFPVITRLWYQYYKERSDLQVHYPDPLDVNRDSFFNWIKNSLGNGTDFDDFFLPSYVMKNLVRNLNVRLNQKSLSLSKEIGINMAGYFQGEFGVAEAARNIARSVKVIGIPHVLNNIKAEVHRHDDKTFVDFEKDNPYPINLIAVNADQSHVFYEKVGSDYFHNKYNIAIWFWELSSFPRKWFSSVKYYDEIWVASKFVADTMAKQFPIPVIRIGCPIKIDESKFIRNRKKFNLKEDEYVFLFIFDFLSVFERKNPLAVIEAFKKAFNKENVSLVIKCTNESRFTSEYKKLSEACDEKNIHLFSGHMDKSDIYSLIMTSDCYISLHRSEGFALTIGEAMHAKKPVIATNYGGNTDFMNSGNSFPVKYKIIRLDKDYGAYQQGNEWADPDIDHASSLMRYVYENQGEAKKIANKGYETIKKNMTLEAIGLEIAKRIEYIQKKLITSTN